MYLAAAVGGDRLGGGAVVRGRGAVGVGWEGGIPLVLGGTPKATVCVCLYLLVTGACSSEWSASH